MTHIICFQILFLVIAAQNTLSHVVEDHNNRQFFCVYTENGRIKDTEFDNSTEICCPVSGKHNQSIIEGRPLGCCKDENYGVVNANTHLQNPICNGSFVQSDPPCCNGVIINDTESCNGRSQSRKKRKRKPSLSSWFFGRFMKWRRWRGKLPLFLFNINLGNVDVATEEKTHKSTSDGDQGPRA